MCQVTVLLNIHRGIAITALKNLDEKGVFLLLKKTRTNSI
jgi:ribosomal protein S25